MTLTLLMTRLDKLFQVLCSGRLLQALVRYGVLAGAEHRHILGREFETVVDIGANRGQFALAARRWAPNARVFSFEPLPGPAQMFRSVFAGDQRVSLHEVAIGPQAAQCEMHVSARDDSSSLLPITGAQSEMFPGTAEVSTTMVQVAPLETFIGAEQICAPAMLKLDVQGFEYEALRGCESLLRKFDLVYCECSFVELYSGQRLAADVIEWLSERGFRIKGMFNLAYDGQGQAIQGDFLFWRGGVGGAT